MSSQTLTDGAYEMLRAAVNMARNQQVQKVKTLRERLVAEFPGREVDVESAIQYWANSIKQKGGA